MSYTKQNFVKGQTLKADHLNAMEDGIVDNMRNGASIIDGTAFAPNNVYMGSAHKPSEIVSWLRSPVKTTPAIYRFVMGDSSVTIRIYTGHEIIQTDSGNYNARVFFGDDLCSLILDSENEKVICDPDWVAPISVKEVADSVNALKNPFSFFVNPDGSYLLVNATYDDINSMDRFDLIRAVYTDNTAPAGTVDAWTSTMPCLHVRKVFSMTSFKASYEFTFMNMERSGYLTLRLNADGTIEKVN